MNESIIKIWFKSGMIVAIILTIISYRLGLGMCVGMLFSRYNLRRNQAYVDTLLNSQMYSKKLHGFYFMTSIVVIALAFFTAVLFDEFISLYTVALGLFWIKPAIIYWNWKGGDDEHNDSN